MKLKFNAWYEVIKADWKKKQRERDYNLRDWRLLTSSGPNWGSPWNPFDHHNIIILRGLWGDLNWDPVMPRDASLSDRTIFKLEPDRIFFSRQDFFEFGYKGLFCWIFIYCDIIILIGLHFSANAAEKKPPLRCVTYKSIRIIMWTPPWNFNLT